MLLVIVSAASAQEKVSCETDLLARMERSLKNTGEGSFRTHVVSEVGDTKEGPWRPSRTSVHEVVLPDRNRQRYTDNQYAEIINIGYQLFKKFPDGHWIQDDNALIPYVARHPAKHLAAPDASVFRCTQSQIGDTVIITLDRIERADANPKVARAQTLSYYFDSSGVLFKTQSVFFSFRYWVLGTHTIEYDPTIRIEVPLQYPGLPTTDHR